MIAEMDILVLLVWPLTIFAGILLHTFYISNYAFFPPWPCLSLLPTKLKQYIKQKQIMNQDPSIYNTGKEN